jgi:AcrR family transcriptional regulator
MAMARTKSPRPTRKQAPGARAGRALVEAAAGATASAEEPASEKRRRIRVAAYRCFLRRGFHETTIDAICERARISKGAFYWYFPSKQAVFLDLLNTWADAVHAELNAEFNAALERPDPEAALRAMLARELRRGHHIMPVWLEFLAHMRRDEEVRAGMAQFHRRARQGIANFFLPALSPEFSEEQVAVFAGTLLSSFVGLVCQDLVDPEGTRASAQLEQFVNMVQLFLERPKPSGWQLAPPRARHARRSERPPAPSRG